MTSSQTPQRFLAMQTSGFLNLPIDIILEIFDFLGPQDILRLAAVCRQLAVRVSHIYYDLAGLSDPRQECYIESNCRGYMDDLTGLVLDLQLTSIKNFVFHSTNSPASVETLVRNIDRLCNVFGRLSSIGSVCLTFHSPLDVVWTMRHRPVQQFTVALRRLLEIVLRKGCTTLHVRHSHTILTNYKFEIIDSNNNLVRRSVLPLVNAVHTPEIQGKGWQFTKVYKTPIQLVPPPTMPSLQLTHIDLFCDFLFTPPYSQWSFDILKSSPILSVTLSLPRNMKEDVFRRYIVPNLAESLPSLQQFKITFHEPYYLDSVVPMIPQIPCLEKLILGQTYYGPFPLICAGNKPDMTSNLTSITGSLEQLVHLLRSLNFPRLKFINVLIECRFRLETHFVETASQFSTIHRILSDMFLNPRITARLLHQAHLLSDFHLQPMVRDFRGRTWVAHFRHVTHLYLEVAMYRTELEYAKRYALSWLRIFYGVTDLQLVCRQPSLDTRADPLRKRWETSIWSAIQKKHPAIQSFSLSYILESSLRHWTCDDEDWRDGNASKSEKNVECHFKPRMYTRSMKPEWVMHGDSESED